MSSSALAAGVRQLRGMAVRQHRADETDEQLLHAFAVHRDEAAFAALVRRHGPMVLGVCRRVLRQEQDAEDAVQATFLVLSRRAETLRKKTALTSFLHGTAYRMALMVKRSAARRRKHEARTPTRAAVDPSGDLLWREVQTLLDEEIARLPEIYRSVFVLCCLESLSRAEAAKRLAVKEGTVSSRLAQAKQRLQERLARRGVELTAVLAALALSAQSASALPAGLFARMSRAAASPTVVALVENGLGISKVKLAMGMVLAASVLAGAGAWACRGLTAHAIAPPPTEVAPRSPGEPPPAAPHKQEAANTVEVHGRVLGPDGQPKAGAKLLLLIGDGKITELGVSAADGRFAVTVPKGARYRYLIAQADGTGLDLLPQRQWMSDKPFQLRLVKDQAIRGRVVNTEGKPVAGAHVAIQSVNIYPNNSLDSFLTAWKKRDYLSGIPGGEKEFWSETGELLPTTTDTDGRFTLRGVGKERLALLRFKGTGIADTEVWIVNREGLDLKSYNQVTRDNTPKGREHDAAGWMLHGPDVSVVVESEKPIRGVVKDVDTGRGRPGVVVHLTASNDGMVMPIRVRAKTDAQGRYQIRGAHKAEAYLLEVESDPLAGYMPCQVWADDSPGYQPINADIGVKKGVIITGKVIDQATGQPVPGFAEADALVNNPFAKDYPEFHASRLGFFTATDDDGTFRVVSVPGPVVLTGRLAYERLPGGLAELMKYKPPLPDPKYPQYFRKGRDFQEYVGLGGKSYIVQGSFCKVLQIKPGVAVVKQDIVLERASALTVKIQDAEGRPLAGVWVAGISPEHWRRALWVDKDSCSAYHVEASKPRLMVFFEPGKKLAGTLTLKGDEKPPVVVKLGPVGSVKGRMLDADGKPLAGRVVGLTYRDRQASEVHEAVHKTKQVVTDAAGAFVFDDLIPGRKFFISSSRRGETLFERGLQPRDAIVHAVKPGECHDLGAIQMKPISE